MRRPSPALVVAVIALIVAMSGTSYAVTQLPRNSVGAKQIKKNAVTSAKIKRAAVTTAKLRDGAVTASKLSASALGSQRGYYALASCVARGSQQTWVAGADQGAYARGQGQGLLCPLEGLPSDARITRVQVQYLDNSDPEALTFLIGSWNPASGTDDLDAPIQEVSVGSDPSIRTLTVTPTAQQADVLSTRGGRQPVVRVDGANSDTRGVVGILVDFERVAG